MRRPDRMTLGLDSCLISMTGLISFSGIGYEVFFFCMHAWFVQVAESGASRIIGDASMDVILRVTPRGFLSSPRQTIEIIEKRHRLHR
jgi:hypothetical protein